MSVTHAASMPLTHAEAASQFLMPVVHGLQALAINGKQAHWNVRGPNFIAVHELTDRIVSSAQAAADQTAERIVSLGLPIDARLGTIAATTSTQITGGFMQWEHVVRSLVADIEVVIDDTRAAIHGLNAIDPASQDVAIAVMQTLDKDRWFLVAHVAE